MRCTFGRGLTVERRIATALWNEQERERIIALKAHEVFCSRGCEHGLDLDDWFRAEQELASLADDVLLTQTETGFEVSIAERPERMSIVLSIAPSSLLILWAGGEMGRNPAIHPTLAMASLPETIAPEKAAVTFRDERVWLHLPYLSTGRSSSAVAAAAGSGKGRAHRK
jgi:hypothetical protein